MMIVAVIKESPFITFAVDKFQRVTSQMSFVEGSMDISILYTFIL